MAEHWFWSRVGQRDGCWNWTGSVDTRGYGHVRRGEKLYRAHRIAYFLTATGDLPPPGDGKMVVMHSCDNRLCCNPSHLSLGTYSDNARDCEAKDRGNHPSRETNGRAVLTEGHVRAIRASKYGKVILSRMYAVSPAQIQRIRAGRQWVA